MRHVINITLWSFTLFLLFGCATVEMDEEKTAEARRVVATVNGETIKRSEFKQELDSTYNRFHQAGQLIDGSMFEQWM